MAQELIINADSDDEAREEDVLDQLVKNQDVNEANNETSPEERRTQNGELDYQNREEIPRPSQDGDWGADEREIVHDGHDAR